MVKDDDTTIKYELSSGWNVDHILTPVHREFNDIVNMTPDDLKSWLGQDRSAKAGWSKGDGETVGHER